MEFLGFGFRRNVNKTGYRIGHSIRWIRMVIAGSGSQARFGRETKRENKKKGNRTENLQKELWNAVRKLR